MADKKLSTVIGANHPSISAISAEYLASSGISKGNVLATFGAAIPLTTLVDIAVPCAASFMCFSSPSGTSFFNVEELIVTVNGEVISVSGIPSTGGINRDVIFKLFGGFLTFSDGGLVIANGVSGPSLGFSSLKIEARTSGTGGGTLYSDLELVQ